ncbi:MAG: trypsin-like peptidase domain-containing protein [Spirochaetales bacterium]|nr:trypsin-like peptidase domain-containing protein [Spirochaetales bacterium]
MKKTILIFTMLILAQFSLFSTIEKSRIRNISQDSSLLSSISEVNKENNYYYQKFSFDVPEGAKGFRINLSESDVYLNLYVSTLNLSVFDASKMIFRSTSTLLDKNLDVTSNFRSGRYYVYVLFDGNLPADGIFYKIGFSVFSDFSAENINLGANLDFLLNKENNYTKIYRIRVGSTDSAIRIDLYGANSDVDLFLFKDQYSGNVEMADFVSSNYSGIESIVVSRSTRPSISSGFYYIVVKDQSSTGITVQGKIMVTRGDSAPSFLAKYPPLPEKSVGIKNVLASTVAVMTNNSQGSGFFVSDDGYILTNWHVVCDKDGNIASDIIIGMNLDNRYSPVEVFRANVVKYDANKDLALLKIYSGLYGQPLPVGLSLPFLSLDTSRFYDIATPIVIAGFPQVGGSSSKPSITVSLGVVSGFEVNNWGLQVKTDANLGEGVSGGPVFNAFHQVIGIATATISSENSKLGYFIPATEIDKSWMDLILKKAYN